MPAINNHRHSPDSPISPSSNHFAATPSDAEELPVVVRRLFVGTGGNVVTVDVKGNTVTHKNVPSGSYLGDVLIRQVKATGTTAADLIAYE